MKDLLLFGLLFIVLVIILSGIRHNEMNFNTTVDEQFLIAQKSRKLDGDRLLGYTKGCRPIEGNENAVWGWCNEWNGQNPNARLGAKQ